MKDRLEDLAEWLNRIAHDDSRAFRLLFEHFYPELIRFASVYIKMRETAEEIVLDVFLKIWLIRKTLPAILNFRAYLFKTTRNQCLNQLQKKSPLAVTLSEGIPLANWVDTGTNPQQQLELLDLQVSVQAAVDALPPQCQLIFQLVKEQGFSYKEVAELLAISPRTVETQIGIAVRKIAAALHSLPED